MTDRITSYNGHPIKLVDNGDGTYSLSIRGEDTSEESSTVYVENEDLDVNVLNDFITVDVQNEDLTVSLLEDILDVDVQNNLEGNKVVEMLTEADAVDGVLTFSEGIESIEIYHEEEELQEFVVNGITLYIASGGWRSPIGNTPSADVEVPEGINCVVTRLV